MNKIYGFCSAGCRYRVPNYDEFAKSATFIQQYTTDELDAIEKYKIEATPIAETLSTEYAGLFDSQGERAVASVGDKVYIFGGTSIYKYDTATQQLSTCSAACRISRTHAVSVGTKIYLFGGYYNNTDNSYVLCYDTETDTISTEVEWDVALYDAAVVAVDGDIYIIGGLQESVKQDAIRKYTIADKTISYIADLPTAVSEMSAAVVGNKIYILGGYQDSSSYSVFCYDTISNEVTTETTLPDYRGKAGATACGTKIYLFGGEHGTSDETDEIVVYDTMTKTAQVSPLKLNKASRYVEAVNINNEVYLFDDDVCKYTFGTYSAQVKLLCSGDFSEFLFAIDTYDQFKDYFFFEILAVEGTTGGTLIAYEINGNRNIITLSGQIASSTLAISGASNVLKYNADAELVADMLKKISELENDAGFITDADVPKKVSELENDAGFITDTASEFTVTSTLHTSSIYGHEQLSISSEHTAVGTLDGVTIDFGDYGAGKTYGEVTGDLRAQAPVDAKSIVNKEYVDTITGDIETALDSIIAMQNSLIGGETV